MSLFLLVSLALPPAMAQSAPQDSAEHDSPQQDSPQQDSPQQGDEEEDEPQPQSVDLDDVKQAPAPAQDSDSTWSGEELAEPAEVPLEELPYQSYQDGFLAGQTDANLQGGQYGLHGMIGFGAGCVAGPCGMLGAPAVEAVINPAVPNGIWAAQSSEYQQGYIEGFQRTIQRKRVIYSCAGATVGTVIGVGAGVALGAIAI